MNRPLTHLACLVVFAGITTSAAARADREIGLGVSYDPRVPVGGLRDLVSGAALAGFQGKWEYYAIDDRFALGFDFQYHYFQQGDEPRTLPIPNGAATAPFTSYAYFISILPTARWFPWGPSLRALRPYLEIGVGATSATGAVLASDLSRRSNEGGFIAQPSAGFLLPFVSREDRGLPAASEDAHWLGRRSRESMFGVAASVAWAFTTADVLSANNVSHVGIQLGLYSKL